MLNFCPYCGSKIIRQDVKFCMACGKSLAEFMGTASEKISDTSKKFSTPRRSNIGLLDDELVKCRKTAEEGYKLAKTNYDEIQSTLNDAADKLNQTDREQNQVDRIQNTDLVKEQRNELRRLFEVVNPIGNDLKLLRERSREFSIVVYGRTMAGKSTLMEILTHGNGQSIGKGAQRTTLDVRDYHWNGLKITDVPGISAFGGQTDERLALEAAKSADLILFLLTSDAPQPDEAEKLAQLKSFGKPVLGVINVKMAFNINDELDIEDLQDKLADTSTIDATIEQFKKFSASHNQDWSNIKFVATHLLSAYQSQDKNPQVFELSRFVEVEDFILDKVRSDGRFLRIKTFADSVAVPMSNIILKIYEQAANTVLESDIWFDKRQQLGRWREKFLERSQQKLDGLYKTLSEELDNLIYNFAENHYEDDKVNEHWQQRLQSAHFDQRYQQLLQELAGECERKRKELSDELTQELKFAFSGNTKTNIELEGTTPWGKIAAMALPNLLLFVPGIGWGARIAIGVGGALFQLLFDDKQKKIREAKEKLRNDLKKPGHEMLGKMHNQVVDIFNNEILAKGVDEFKNLLAGYQFMLARLGHSQSKVAYTLFKKFSELNAKLLAEAIDYRDAGYADIEAVARIPGELTVAFVGDANLNTDKLADLLGEKILLTHPHEKISETVKEILHSDIDIDRYPLDFTKAGKKTKHTYSVLPKEKVNATSFKIAQQIAGIPIIVDTFKRKHNKRTNSSTAKKNRNR
ncbi:MAG: 50S ribosome-binding GTPase [Selenomonadaceae bacterium]|nr:50S ribosome-binding GTPase [Selenomonadaceae bacterium]